jgi:CheY-like chemotaxis protein
MKNANITFQYKLVMIIDDSKIDRLLVELNIKRYGFAEEIISKESAKSALQYLMSSANCPEKLPELIFLDIRMPEIDGFGFLFEYEKLPDSIKKNCIIMMLSSSLDPEDLDRAEKNRFVKRFVNKPINGQKLQDILEDVTLRSPLQIISTVD